MCMLSRHLPQGCLNVDLSIKKYRGPRQAPDRVLGKMRSGMLPLDYACWPLVANSKSKGFAKTSCLKVLILVIW